MIKKIYKLSLVAFLGFGSFAFAQQAEGKVGINTPDGESPKATLDIVAKKSTQSPIDGILIPRVTTADADNMGNGTVTPEESTLIYITDGTKGTNYASLVDGKGFYYFDTKVNGNEKKWVKVGAGEKPTYSVFEPTENYQKNNYPQNVNLIKVSASIGKVCLPNVDSKKDIGRVVFVHKIGRGNTDVYSYDQCEADVPSTEIEGPSNIFANKGSIFVWDGAKWNRATY